MLLKTDKTQERKRLMSAKKQQKVGDGIQHRKSQLKARKKQKQQQQHLAE
jgi:hypothetical protein